MSEKPDRRKRAHYLIDRRFQVGFALRLLCILALFALFMLFEAYVTLWPVLAPFVPDTMLPWVLQRLGIRVALFAVPVGLVIVAMGIVLTHRIAGPLHRLERTLDTLLAGGRVQPVHLRKHDELKPLCSRINRVIQLLEARRIPPRAVDDPETAPQSRSAAHTS